eukprot:TRINITY_DN3075_c0_g1_i1.p1 TRINITY_DN3075_c0_g1~~TRINITY_DN3075_c0_g1_i1.p1  ORF type:complete len:245 (+),score=29.09 TRINITY_DN3075_c0_g1_i1:69-803(+)
MKKFCESHNQIYTQYCKKCRQALCVECAEHTGHSMMSLVHLLVSEELAADIDELASMKDRIGATLDEIPYAKESLQSFYESEKEVAKSRSEQREIEKAAQEKLTALSSLTYKYKELRLAVSKRKKMYSTIQARVNTATTFVDLYSGFEKCSGLVLPSFIEECKQALEKLDSRLGAISSASETPLCSDMKAGKASLECGHYLCTDCICGQRIDETKAYCLSCGYVPRAISTFSKPHSSRNNELRL